MFRTIYGTKDLNLTTRTFVLNLFSLYNKFKRKVWHMTNVDNLLLNHNMYKIYGNVMILKGEDTSMVHSLKVLTKKLRTNTNT